ncbi:KamA family radical SAM protein [bacterium]|jgi:lysine 2,3-aminomutase|nr:KamA family radical SAM protein [bacterium]
MKEELRSLEDEVPLGSGRSNSVPFYSVPLVSEGEEVLSDFQKKFFPGSTKADWDSWLWQIKNSITDAGTLSKMFDLTEDELAAMKEISLPFRITPYYASLLYGRDPEYPLRKTMIPRTSELIRSFGEAADPLSEESMSPVPNLVHRYPDRVLFLATEFCSSYCRYCTRHRVVGNKNELHRFNSKCWDESIDYIARHTEVRDVLISGGDPLTMPDAKIDYLLSRIRAIPHVEIIRLGTKVPAVLPQRITPKLLRILKKYHPLMISIHFTHPDELTPESSAACSRLADAGIPLGSQTVLLKGVNNDAKVMTELFHKLLMARVRPYYLYQCDPVIGSAHFRTSVDEGLDMIRQIRGFTSGYAVPHYVIDAPGGGGKIPLIPKYFQGEDDDYVYLKNFEGKDYKYPKHS